TAIDGYGYFTKAFYSDVILIPFALVGNLTNAAFAYEFMIFTMTVFCGVFTYITINSIYKNTYAAAIGAILFTFAIYRLFDIYHRAALGEALSFTFIPIVFLGIYQIIKGDYKKWYILTIGFSLMIFTHLISTVLMFVTMLILLLIYSKSLFKEPKRIWYLVLAGLVTVVIVSYYIWPMAEQMFSNLFYYDRGDEIFNPQGLAYPVGWVIWGMFTGILIPKQAFIPGVGLLLTCAIVLRLFVYEKSPKLKSIDVGVIIGLCYIIACLPMFPWSVFPFTLLSFIQLPWRLLEFSSFFFAVAGGYYLSRILKTNMRRLLAVGGIVIAIALVFANNAREYQLYRCEEPITTQATIINYYHLGGAEYIPLKVPSVDFLAERKDSVLYQQNETMVSDFARNRNVVEFTVATQKADSLELPLLYYKGYHASLNGKDIPVSESRHGLVQVAVGESGRIEAYYAGTFLQKASFAISVIAILFFCIFIYLDKKKRKA
ncbi:MAG: hypothetical protein LBU84_00500, partial [Prevotella sp.]|nr:hypothetical protein [Prevotella sp.]